jgi:hypothetical protein
MRAGWQKKKVKKVIMYFLCKNEYRIFKPVQISILFSLIHSVIYFLANQIILNSEIIITNKQIIRTF